MLKNKILVIFMLILLLLTFGITNCFASVAVDSSNGQTIYNKVVTYCNSNNITIYDYIITSDGYVYVATQSDYEMFINHLWDGDFIFCKGCMIFEFSDAETFKIAVSSSNGSNYTEVTADEGKNITYSSYDVLDNEGTLFFQVTPLGVGSLALIAMRLNLTEEITTTLVGLLKLLIPFLICLIGFWKGWHLLLKILRKA